MLRREQYFMKATSLLLRRSNKASCRAILSERSLIRTPNVRERQDDLSVGGSIRNWCEERCTVRLRQRMFTSNSLPDSEETFEVTPNHQQPTLERSTSPPLQELNVIKTAADPATRAGSKRHHTIPPKSMVPLSHHVRAIMRDIRIGQLSDADVKSILTETFEMCRTSNKGATGTTKKANIAYAEQLVHRLVQEVNARHLQRLEVKENGNHESTAVQTSHVIRSLGTMWHYLILGSSRLPLIHSESQTTSDQDKSDATYSVSEQPFITTGRLLMNMLQLHHQHPRIHPPPTAALYNAWLYSCCLCSSVSDDALHTAEAILQSVEGDSDPREATESFPMNKSSFDILPPPANLTTPTVGMYNQVLLIHANRAKTDYGAAASAEDVLMRMTKVGVHPVTGTFNRVLKAWSECPEKEGGNRAADILHLMLKLSDGASNIVHGNDFAPDEISFGTVITAFAKREQPEACQLILEDAITYFASDPKRSCRMTDLNQCWDYALFGWANSGRPDAPERVEAMLNHGITINGQTYKAVPTKTTYRACIEAHLRSGRPDRIEKAERYIDIMIELMQSAKDRKNSGVAESTLTTREFDALIHAWFRSSTELENIGIHNDNGTHPVGYTSTKALNLLFQMLKLQEEGHLSCVPSSGSFHMCIESLCRTGGACITATKRVKKVLKSKEAISESHELTPLYKSSMRKYAMIAADKALEILDIAEDRSVSVDSSYAALIQLLCRVKDPHYTFTAVKVLERYEQQTDERNMNWQRDKVWMYHTIIAALNELGSLQAAEAALVILRRIPKSGKRAIDRNKIWVYTGVLSAFSKHPGERSFVVALELFKELMSATPNTNDGQESNNSINVDFCERVLWMLADSCNNKSAVYTCDVLISIFDRYSAGEINFQPSMSCFNACIHALTKFRDLKHTSDAVMLLKQIISKYEDRSISQLPSKAAFDAVIQNCTELGTDEMLQHAKCVALVAEKYINTADVRNH